MHFKDVKALNIPFFLHISLRKMSNKVQKHRDNFSSHLFHCGLIRLLIIKELAKRRKTWGSYLEKLGYLPITPTPPKEKGTPSSGKNKPDTTTKRQKKDAKEMTPTVAGSSKASHAPANKRMKILVLDLETGSPKTYEKPTESLAKS